MLLTDRCSRVCEKRGSDLRLADRRQPRVLRERGYGYCATTILCNYNPMPHATWLNSHLSRETVGALRL